ncbi:hypothetical protein M0R45_002282 [Rubus argutus]|uniref:Uncharacterized protein n=1 Tax=Rubus argutus TaxID=59490 RepID=A0AAW1VHB1_RUBAR
MITLTNHSHLQPESLITTHHGPNSLPAINKQTKPVSKSDYSPAQATPCFTAPHLDPQLFPSRDPKSLLDSDHLRVPSHAEPCRAHIIDPSLAPHPP